MPAGGRSVNRGRADDAEAANEKDGETDGVGVAGDPGVAGSEGISHREDLFLHDFGLGEAVFGPCLCCDLGINWGIGGSYGEVFPKLTGLCASFQDLVSFG